MPTQTFNVDGSWNAPASLTGGVVQAECWGPAGGGGDDNGTTGGGGGGGGAYSKKNVNVTAGTAGYVVGCPAGGVAGTAGGTGGDGGGGTPTSFTGDAADQCIADYGRGGGAGGAGGLGGAFGAASSSTGTTKFNGGGGGGASLNQGAGGGSSAGTAGAGNAGSSPSGGAAPTGGAKGGDGGAAISGFNATAGDAPGGGGGGAGATGAAAAGAAGRVTLTWTQSAPDVRIPQTAAVSTPSPPPFPGQVTVIKNPLGDPPPSIASGSLSQFKVETPSPAAYPGDVLRTGRVRFGDTPLPPVGGKTGTYRPIPEPMPGHPGAVLTASRGVLGGLSNLPRKIQIVETVLSPPGNAGGVIVGQRRVAVVDDRTSPAIVQASEHDPEIRQPVAWHGTPARAAVSRGATVVASPEPPQFGGSAIIGREGFGVAATPIVRSVVIRSVGPSDYPGAVLLSHSRLATTPSRRPSPHVVYLPGVLPDLRQPVYWRGTPAREAAFRTGTIVATPTPSFYPGGVIVQRGSFGLVPLPARPIQVKIEPSLTEPGRILFTSKTPTAPIDRPRLATVVSLSQIPFAGSVLFSGGHAAPTVGIPHPMIVAGATEYPPLSEPFFGWGERTGTGAPSGPLPGNPVVLPGVDNGSVTLTSEGCECQ